MISDSSEDDDSVTSESTSGSYSDTFTSGIGTSTYAPPEQLEGEHYNDKADMFSLGIILAELFHPFTTSMERAIVLSRVRSGQIPDVFKASWPQQGQLLEELVARDPSRRLDTSAVLRLDFLRNRDELVVRMRKKVMQQDKEIERLTILLSEKDKMISQLQQKLAAL
eukprot:m.211029 g.211029  ORF g.211029 m.211029 type:complete len:167 (+) comp39749_c0_seq86:1452-1952(+)